MQKRIKRPPAKRKGGQAPDTTAHLGTARRAWLKSHGGYAPTIKMLIDEAMLRKEAEQLAQAALGLDE
jgi:hypothetical protein